MEPAVQRQGVKVANSGMSQLLGGAPLQKILGNDVRSRRGLSPATPVTPLPFLALAQGPDSRAPATGRATPSSTLFAACSCFIHGCCPLLLRSPRALRTRDFIPSPSAARCRRRSFNRLSVAFP